MVHACMGRAERERPWLKHAAAAAHLRPESFRARTKPPTTKSGTSSLASHSSSRSSQPQQQGQLDERHGQVKPEGTVKTMPFLGWLVLLR